MVLYVTKYDIHPDKTENFMEWTKSAISRLLAAPGLVEFRAYRPVAGAPQIVTTCEFADMTTWATWQAHQDVQDVLWELHTLAVNVSTELWGPSPVIPEPIRPDK